jgi:hypothetical protein
MDTKEYDKWIEQLEAGNYGEYIATEPNPYYFLQAEVEQKLIPVIEIAKENNISIAELTKTLVTVGYREGLMPA